MRRFNDLEIPDPFLEYEMFQLRRGPHSWASPNLPVTLDLKSGDVLFSKTTNYRPLQVDHEGRPKHRPELGDLPSLSGRSNLVAASNKSQHIFVAHGDMIGISETPSGPRFMFGLYDQMIPKPYPDDESVGYLVDDIPYGITNMHVGEIGGEEVLVATDDSGHIAVHFPRDNFSRPALTMKVALSAWGIATHSSKRLLAISCNALYVTVFHLGMGIEGWDWTRPADGMGEGIPNIELRGPKQNIPCVAFERNGNYVASGDLDGSIHLWACRTGQKVQQIRCQGPIWAIRFVNKTDFKLYQKTDEESVKIPSKRNEPPSESDPHISSNDIEPPSDPDVNSWGPRSAVSGRRRWTPTRTANPTTASTQSSQDEGLETLRESPSVYHSGNEAEDNDGSSSTEGSDIESRPRFRWPLGGPESKTLKATKTFPSLPEELDDQLLLFTLSTKLCMAGKDAGTEGNRPVIRQLISQPYRVIINGYFCTLEVVPSLSMVYVTSPCRIGWLYRLVYFPDQKSYDLVPEHIFQPTIPNHMVNEIWQRYHGAVVQPFCIGGPQDSNTDKGNTGTTSLDSTRMGVRIVAMEATGYGDWWTVRRVDDHQVGVQEIVL